MESGHRYRLLIYFAALVLCLSVCFAYAEGPASVTASSLAPCVNTPTSVVVEHPAHLLFSTSLSRSSFMPALTIGLVAEAAEVTVQPVSADALLHGLDMQNNRSHSLLHAVFPMRHKLKLVTNHTQAPSAANASSARMTVVGDGEAQ